MLIGGAFGVAAGGANSFVLLAVLVALVGMGIGGSPVFSRPLENVNLHLLRRQRPGGFSRPSRLDPNLLNDFFSSH